jgi:hypothetical protein
MAASVTACLAPESYELCTAHGAAVATRAPSCFLRPAVGDEVWLVPDADGAYLITAVLHRSEEAAVIELPGKHTELHAAQTLRIRAPRFEVAALQSRIASETVEVFASRVEAGLGKARVVARKLDTAVDSVVSRVKRSFRWIEELDQLRSRQIDYRATDNARLEGGSTIVSAERIVQVRGEEVHLS